MNNTTLREAAADLLTETHTLVKTIEPLFYNLLATSTHHKLDTIQISTSRAREIAADLHILKKKLQSFIESEKVTESATDQHLDQMIGLN